MPVTNYITVRGRIISEITDGQVLNYHSDMLGNVHMLTDQNGDVVKTMRYKPFGEVLSRVGSIADRAYQWVGSYGYRATTSPSSSHYVRARHYSAQAGSWTTVDRLWPEQLAFAYANGWTVSAVDPSGSQKQRRPHKLPWQGTNHVPGTGWKYGSYCGQSNIANPGWSILPQDDLDACCQIHDRCLEAHYGAGFQGFDAHICCDQPLLDCAKWVGQTSCKKAPSFWEQLQCVEAVQELTLGIEIALSVSLAQKIKEEGIFTQTVPCVPKPRWPKLVKAHWGNPDTPVPVGVGCAKKAN
jgi:RHS repeat-associated protein